MFHLSNRRSRTHRSAPRRFLDFTLSCIAATSCVAQIAPPVPPAEAPILLDPTQSSPRMRAALNATGSAIPEVTVRGLVRGAGREGVVMLEVGGRWQVLARPGVPFTAPGPGGAPRLIIRSISSEGVELEAPLQNETILISSYGPSDDSRRGIPGEVEYVEFRDLALIDALRMLADQTGRNYSASASANKIPVSTLLRNVRADTVVEEICKSHNLWFKRDEASGITRIMTMEEYERDLVGFREEQTEVFTLKYPNVTEVAVAITDLYGDRVQLSLGRETQDEEEIMDLESRMERFDVLNRRTQGMGNLEGNIVGAGVSGFSSVGGLTSGFGAYGANGGFGSRRDRSIRQRRVIETQERALLAEQAPGAFQNLTPEQAQRLDQALAGGPGAERDAAVEALRRRPPTIFVTASRRNNTVAVRTADPRVLEEIRALVLRLDVPTPLVLLEVKVLSIELGKGFRSVFDYAFKAGDASGAFISPLSGGPIQLGTVAGAGLSGSDMTFVVVSDYFSARLQLLEEKNCVKTIATPLLLTANNEVSRLFLGEERPLVRNINSQTIITDNNVATTPNTTTTFRSVGTTLLITPNINSDRTVTLRLLQENSFISPNAASIPVVTGNRADASAVQDVKVDVVATRSVSGTFVAKDRMAVAVGGLIEDVNSDRRGQVPVLGDIPVLGTLFRRQEKEKIRRELLILIRPHVISTPADGERISQSLLDQLAPTSVDRLVDEGFLPLAEEKAVLVPTRKAIPVAPRNRVPGK